MNLALPDIPLLDRKSREFPVLPDVNVKYDLAAARLPAEEIAGKFASKGDDDVFSCFLMVALKTKREVEATDMANALAERVEEVHQALSTRGSLCLTYQVLSLTSTTDQSRQLDCERRIDSCLVENGRCRLRRGVERGRASFVLEGCRSLAFLVVVFCCSVRMHVMVKEECRFS